MTGRTYQLSGEATGTHRLLTEFDAPAPGKRSSMVTITRTGTFRDPRYGEFDITRDMLLSMVRNHQSGAAGQAIFIDVNHQPGLGAAAEVKELSVEGNRLRARVEWTDYGIAAVKERGFRYLSAEYHDDYVCNESGKHHGPTLLGAGLTVRPVIKRLYPVQVSEASGVPVLVHPALLAELTKQLTECHMNWLDSLRKKLSALGLKDDVVTKLLAAAETAAKSLGEDAAALKALADSFETNGKLLAEQIAANPGAPISINVTAPAGKTLSEADVDALVAKKLADAADNAKKLSESLEAKRATFRKALADAQGLSDDTRKLLGEAEQMIGADWTDASVKALAEQQLKVGEQMECARQLSAMGRGPGGSVRVSLSEGNTVKQLSEQVRGYLKASGFVKAPEKEHPFITRYLSQFDAQNGAAYDRELKALSGGPVVISDTNLPVSVQREVIREALSDLTILELLDARVDPTTAATHQVPYEARDVSAVLNNGIVYEGQPIPRAGVSQALDTAYIVPMKLALELTDEVMHFSRASQINWDAMGRTVESNARYFRELVARRATNEWIRNLDAYAAAASGTDTLTSQVNGTETLFKTTYWPIVRPFQPRDLQGNAVGTLENAMTVSLGGTALSQYDGTGTQASGNYWQIVSANLGTFRIVNQAGVVQAPSNATALVATYSYATNIIKFDTDLGSLTKAERMDGLLQAIGTAKATMADDRYVRPDFMLMTHTLNEDASCALTFAAANARSGSSTGPDGDLARIKGLPAYSTNAPSTDIGDERIVIAQRGQLKLTVAKAFALGAPFQITNSSGLALGKMGAYGIEYNSLKVPTATRNRGISVIAYSAAARTAI